MSNTYRPHGKKRRQEKERQLTQQVNFLKDRLSFLQVALATILKEKLEKDVTLNVDTLRHNGVELEIETLEIEGQTHVEFSWKKSAKEKLENKKSL